MKNKSKTYLLLIAVIVIWGLIGYRLVDSLSPKQELIVPQHSITNFSKQLIQLQDTFSLAQLDRDPFLGTLEIKPTIKKSPKINKEISWPEISYKGLIKKKNSINSLYVIKVMDKEFLVKQGQVFNEISLTKGNAKAIKLKHKGQTKQFNLVQ